MCCQTDGETKAGGAGSKTCMMQTERHAHIYIRSIPGRLRDRPGAARKRSHCWDHFGTGTIKNEFSVGTIKIKLSIGSIKIDFSIGAIKIEINVGSIKIEFNIRAIRIKFGDGTIEIVWVFVW